MKYLMILVGLLSLSYCQWVQKYYVDKFGDKIGKRYIQYTDIHGTFSNSATDNSELIVRIIIDYLDNDSLPDIGFDLYEYGRGPAVGEAIGNASYGLTIKLSDNTTEEYYLQAGKYSLFLFTPLINESGGYAHDASYYTGGGTGEPLLSYLKKESKPIKCYIIINSEYGVCGRYNFKINPAGFSNALSKIKPKGKKNE